MLKNQDIPLHVQICGFPWKTGRCGNTESIFPKATNCLEVTSDFFFFLTSDFLRAPASASALWDLPFLSQIRSLSTAIYHDTCTIVLSR